LDHIGYPFEELQISYVAFEEPVLSLNSLKTVLQMDQNSVLARVSLMIELGVLTAAALLNWREVQIEPMTGPTMTVEEG
jgi:hypothetical protein